VEGKKARCCIWGASELLAVGDDGADAAILLRLEERGPNAALEPGVPECSGDGAADRLLKRNEGVWPEEELPFGAWCEGVGSSGRLLRGDGIAGPADSDECTTARCASFGGAEAAAESSAVGLMCSCRCENACERLFWLCGVLGCSLMGLDVLDESVDAMEACRRGELLSTSSSKMAVVALLFSSREAPGPCSSTMLLNS